MFYFLFMAENNFGLSVNLFCLKLEILYEIN